MSTAAEELRRSLSARVPAPPAEVVEWMVRFGDGSGGKGGAPSDMGVRALAEAMARPGRDREGAYALLAADGLITYAVEDAARAADPEAALLALVSRVAETRAADSSASGSEGRE